MLSLYKLIILFMLKASNGSLSAAQLSEFLLGKDYTDFFTFQQALDELDSTGLIGLESNYNRTLYHLTEDGENALHFYTDRISSEIKDEIYEYLTDKQIEIRQTRTVFADYVKSPSGAYMTRCQLRENDTPLVDLSLALHSKTQAEIVCRQWKENYEEVYGQLLQTLIR